MGLLDWAEDTDETTMTVKEVGGLALSLGVTEFLLSTYAAHSHAKDPKNGGIPGLGPVGIEGPIGLLATGLAAFGGETLGTMGQTILLGIGLAGVGHASSGAGTAFGRYLAGAPATTGSLGEGGRDLSDAAKEVMNAYDGN